MIGCVLGPTGSGKSSFAIATAKAVNGAIISCDSVQIYQGFNIGSGKVTAKEMAGIPHYMLDIVTANEPFTVADYVKALKESIKIVQDSGYFPIIVGGTGLYFKAFAYQYSFKEKAIDEAYRKKLYQLKETNGSAYLHNMLEKVDAYSAKRIHPNHVTRIIGALEAIHLTGKPIWEQENESGGLRDDLIAAALDVNRLALYEQIEKRVDQMIDEGLLQEVEVLLNAGVSEDSAPMKTIGYKEMVLFLKGEMTFAESVLKMKQSTRQYAKRQLTWFRGHSEITWLPYTNNHDKKNSLKWFINEIEKKQQL
ncbi:hypothetical protein AZF37_06135 [endosymbiont 'TC1' of Trimyema compressum]|uniref:tRNA (adenosine(37)-N6)-dimethylallyltransferase MiaA n=1 Tax=endosymbiont 'TC1' of Trimyema compressum TaxID=243899 RepID=UPI0007F107A2|nr:tRNA (adenosine(37)-N6)-dimethylallyltransferase MiaA [endosymbiont 'TC1' of Trimyema compressum]AMP20805.1 hypothetical protein AZF37_06135 [endosymbiont 'TC1' of Trimyema compressum]